MKKVSMNILYLLLYLYNTDMQNNDVRLSVFQEFCNGGMVSSESENRINQ